MFNFYRWIHKYPFETLHEMNIDWVIEAVKELAKELENYEIVNQITYRGHWDITKQYPTWSIVIDEATNTGYISLQPVPAGVDINNSDYWEMVAEFTSLIGDLGDRVEALETEVTDLTNVTYNYWSGKKVVAYGDSTAKNGSLTTYMTLLPSITGCTVTNRAVPGTRMNHSANNGVDLINASTDLGDYDILTLSYGTNEWQTSERVDEIYNDVEAIINAVKNKNPKLEIVFITPFYSYRDWSYESPNLNGQNLYLHDVNNIIAYVCNLHGIPVINLYYQSPCNEYNYTDLLRNDSGGIYVHPTEKFARDLAYIIKNFNTGYKATFELDDTLATYDYMFLQNQVTTTDFGNMGGITKTGLYLRFAAAESDHSVNKTIMSNFIYRIVGHTSVEFTITIGTWTRTISVGAFDFVVTGLPTNFLPVTVTSSDSGIIQDFHIYKVNLAGFNKDPNCRYGTRCKLTPTAAVTLLADNDYYPTVVFSRDHITFDFSGFQIAGSPVASGTTLFTIGYNWSTSGYSHGTINAVHAGVVYPLELTGNSIKSMKELPVGTYTFTDEIFFSRNIHLTN